MNPLNIARFLPLPVLTVGIKKDTAIKRLGQYYKVFGLSRWLGFSFIQETTPMAAVMLLTLGTTNPPL